MAKHKQPPAIVEAESAAKKAMRKSVADRQRAATEYGYGVKEALAQIDAAISEARAVGQYSAVSSLMSLKAKVAGWQSETHEIAAGIEHKDNRTDDELWQHIRSLATDLGFEILPDVRQQVVHSETLTIGNIDKLFSGA